MVIGMIESSALAGAVTITPTANALLYRAFYGLRWIGCIDAIAVNYGGFAVRVFGFQGAWLCGVGPQMLFCGMGEIVEPGEKAFLR